MSMFPTLSFDCNLVAAVSDVGPPSDCEKNIKQDGVHRFSTGSCCEYNGSSLCISIEPFPSNHFHRTQRLGDEIR